MQTVSPPLLILLCLPLHRPARLRRQSNLMRLDYLPSSNPSSKPQSANTIPLVLYPTLLPSPLGHLCVKGKKAIRTGSRNSTEKITMTTFVKISGAEFLSTLRSS